LGRYDQDGVLCDVVERVDFVAFIYAESAASEEEKGDVGAERGCNFDQALQRDTLARELKVAKERGGSVAGASAHSATCGNFLCR